MTTNKEYACAKEILAKYDNAHALFKALSHEELSQYYICLFDMPQPGYIDTKTLAQAVYRGAQDIVALVKYLNIY